MNKKKVGILAGWWLWIPAIWLILRGAVKLFFGGLKLGQTMDQWLLANVLGGVGLYALLAVGLLGSAVILTDDDQPGYRSSLRQDNLSKILAIFMIFACIATTFQVVKIVWDNDKDLARYYNQATTFIVPDTEDPPSAIQYLMKGAEESGRNGCDMLDASDMHTCIVEGELNPEGWEPRVGSLDGAIFAIKRTSGDQQRISLDEDMVTYLNEWNGNSARWSGVLDGSGKEQPLGGVSEWDGSNTTNCKFEGRYALDRAFGGERGNSLPNLLAERFPTVRYEQSDVWGYCNGDEPIVVIPTTKQIRFKDRTVDTAGGLIIVQGQGGQVKLTYIREVKPSEYPGPVYAMSLVERQREMSKWAAGRKNEDRRSFGFEPATSEAQEDNTSEYLLKNSVTGRLEWVTPLTLRSSTSELFIAYAISPADSLSDGNLNPLSLYILGEDDHRRVNIDNLEADALDYLAKNAGTFISNGGKLVEFTPVDGDVWRAFGELKGRVVYRLEISAGGRITPQLVSVGATGSPTQTGESSDTGLCGQDPKSLTPNQLVICIQALADELGQRQQPSSIE
ncbi:hypothetical protein H6792_00025 [Candidatus Nomurabacteria bacterium]|nr:hypothetical protein [Candidatus Nomurabacteria bacterium]